MISACISFNKLKILCLIVDKKSFEMVAVCSMERETVKFNGDLAEEASSGSDEYVDCLDEGEEETDLLLTPLVRILSATE